ncbi:hypothetical protein SCP_0603160 [Sparassis crispa]|uniref:Uncharacterized protein n=1 Tax=Sparassis crispa TaxID=139825 RepID=A0A401GQ45_9APHY|nr:hypothetical protein SCP_0603160 [Sparassis crispa]GBE84338.1 hypothetical protein SCP_0603160 [Sparassis crispa]
MSRTPSANPQYAFNSVEQDWLVCQPDENVANAWFEAERIIRSDTNAWNEVQSNVDYSLRTYSARLNPAAGSSRLSPRDNIQTGASHLTEPLRPRSGEQRKIYNSFDEVNRFHTGLSADFTVPRLSRSEPARGAPLVFQRLQSELPAPGASWHQLGAHVNGAAVAQYLPNISGIPIDSVGELWQLYLSTPSSQRYHPHSAPRCRREVLKDYCTCHVQGCNKFFKGTYEDVENHLVEHGLRPGKKMSCGAVGYPAVLPSCQSEMDSRALKRHIVHTHHNSVRFVCEKPGCNYIVYSHSAGSHPCPLEKKVMSRKPDQRQL